MPTGLRWPTLRRERSDTAAVVLGDQWRSGDGRCVVDVGVVDGAHVRMDVDTPTTALSPTRHVQPVQYW